MDMLAQPRLDELAPPRRNHYFYGKLLDELHLSMEQEYMNGKRWMLNRLALGVGALCGLEVTADGNLLSISSGVAIDAYGREIIVPHPVHIDPSKISADCNTTRARDPATEKQVYLTLCYRECKADFVPVLVTDCQPAEQCAPSAIVEGYCISVNVGAPPALTEEDEALCDALSGGTDEADKRKRINAVLAGACAKVSGDPCVLLAAVEFADDGSIKTVDAAGARQQVYSNEVLFDLLMCLQSGGQGAEGPQGPQGEQGIQGIQGLQGLAGQKGDPGPGLEEKLVHINGISWVHQHLHTAADSPLADIEVHRLVNDKDTVVPERGFVIAFDQPIPSPVLAPLFSVPLFEVLVANAMASIGYMWIGLLGEIVPLTSVHRKSAHRIDKAAANLVNTPPDCQGLAFLVTEETQAILGRVPLIMIRVRGDFILDAKGKAIDAEFPRAQFPTGDGPAGSKFGLQGGTFESWLTMFEGIKGGQMAGSRASVEVNRASPLDIAMVSGVGMKTANAIVEARDQKRGQAFRNLNELVGVGGIDAARLKAIKSSIIL